MALLVKGPVKDQIIRTKNFRMKEGKDKKKNSHFKWSIPIRGFFFYFDFLLGHLFLGILPAVTSMPEENEPFIYGGKALLFSNMFSASNSTTL